MLLASVRAEHDEVGGLVVHAAEDHPAQQRHRAAILQGLLQLQVTTTKETRHMSAGGQCRRSHAVRWCCWAVVHACRHQVELLLFWIEANDFRLNVPGQAFMALQARKIVKKYIGDGAKMKASRG